MWGPVRLTKRKVLRPACRQAGAPPHPALALAEPEARFPTHYSLHSRLTLILSQFECAQAQQGQDNGNDPKADHHFGLLPPLQLKMMMDGGHEKHPLAPGLE